MSRPSTTKPGIRKSRSFARPLAAAALLVGFPLLAGCQSAPVKPPAEQLDAQLASCSSEYDYRAGAMEANLGPHELAPEERAWRACVYTAVETNVKPNMDLPDRVQEVIDADRTMTDEVAAGTLTRAERRARVDKLLTALFNDEELARRDQAARMEQTMEADRDRMRDMRRQEDVMRRRMSPRI